MTREELYTPAVFLIYGRDGLIGSTPCTVKVAAETLVLKGVYATMIAAVRALMTGAGIMYAGDPNGYRELARLAHPPDWDSID